MFREAEGARTMTTGLPQRRQGNGLDLVEVAVVVFIVAVLSASLAMWYTPRDIQGAIMLAQPGLGELGDLERRYGPARNSQFGEEWIVRDFFQDRRGGVFVDIGANDYRHDSTTYYLETALGWTGLAV